MSDPTIFVSIASYRDPDLGATIASLIGTAAKPPRVVVGVCRQSLPGDDLSLPAIPGLNLRITDVSAREATGVGWPRALVQALSRDEDYSLQVDSHMRFAPGWDETLIAMLRQCPAAKPVLSSYPPSFERTPDGTIRCQDGLWSRMSVAGFDDYGILTFTSELYSTADAPGTPPWTGLFAGGLVFASGTIIREVPYDPGVYFTGEEIAMSARLFTSGWDIFAPTASVAWHDYGRRRRQWEDDDDWVRRHAASVARVRRLLRMAGARVSGYFGLNHVRTLLDFEDRIGVKFGERTVNG